MGLAAHDQRAAALVVLNQMELPQRVLAIQRLHRQFGHPLLQRRLFLRGLPCAIVPIRVLEPGLAASMAG